MNSTLRTVLSLLDAALSDPDISTDLADILSATRGPDSPALARIKGVTTAVIRAAAFPDTAHAARTDYTRMGKWVFASDRTLSGGIVLPMAIEDIPSLPVGHPHAHFYRHIRDAALALGLTISTPAFPKTPTQTPNP